jgi:hypothetical protein
MSHLFPTASLEALRTTSGMLYAGAVLGLLGVMFTKLGSKNN